jgi:hypothetical protein
MAGYFPMGNNEGRDARDAALDGVLNRNWIWRAQIMDFIENDLHQGWKGTGEDIRHLAQEAGIVNPGHPNAWGAAIMQAVKNRWLQRTGRMHQPKDKASHSRGIWEYVRFDPLD